MLAHRTHVYSHIYIRLYARSCELYIGTMSGGMDQAISSMANAGSAARIDFEPLKATPVALPSSSAFVVSNTLEESVKAIDAEKRYNRRCVVSCVCVCACALLCLLLELKLAG